MIDYIYSQLKWVPDGQRLFLQAPGSRLVFATAYAEYKDRQWVGTIETELGDTRDVINNATDPNADPLDVAGELAQTALDPETIRELVMSIIEDGA